MEIDRYLDRIGSSSISSLTGRDRLFELQRSHLLAVPFENLDIHWARRIKLDTMAFYNKIVVEKRGAFCYELNGLFHELLIGLGLDSRMLSACVASGDGTFTSEFDHLALLVNIGSSEYLVDVGFGSFTAEPLLFEIDIEQTDDNGIFVIRKLEDDYFEIAKRDGDAWKGEYKFRAVGRRLVQFETRCDHQQDSPLSHFRKGKLCSIMTNGGRKTLTDSSFIVTSGAGRDEVAVGSDDEFYQILKDEFNIERKEAGYA